MGAAKAMAAHVDEDIPTLSGEAVGEDDVALKIPGSGAYGFDGPKAREERNAIGRP